MFPEQLRGPHKLSTWQVKKVFSGGSTAGTGGTTTAPDCTTGFVPASTNTSTVAGVWTGYDSPFDWPAGNVQGKPAGTPKIWAQVAMEGARAYPTQSRTMFMGDQPPGCSRFGQTDAFVPFQPNLNADGTANPLAGKDDAALYGAVKRDPGGLPRGTLEHIELSDFFLAPGKPFEATVHVRSGQGTLDRGTVALTAPTGWTVGPAQRDRPDPRAPRLDRDLRGHAAGERGRQHRRQAVGAPAHRPPHRLHRDRRARRLTGRGPLPALGQVEGVRQLAHRHGAARAARRPLRRRHVDGAG